MIWSVIATVTVIALSYFMYLFLTELEILEPNVNRIFMKQINKLPKNVWLEYKKAHSRGDKERGHKLNIHAIYKLKLSPSVIASYQAARDELRYRNQMQLYHGTTLNSVEKICTMAFDYRAKHLIICLVLAFIWRKFHRNLIIIPEPEDT